MSATAPPVTIRANMPSVSPAHVAADVAAHPNDVRLRKAPDGGWTATLGTGDAAVVGSGPTPRDALLTLTFKLVYGPDHAFDEAPDA